SAVACSAGAQPAASTDRNSPATYLPLIRIETPLVEKDAPSCHCRPACVTGPGAAVRGAPSLRPQALPPATNNCTSLHRWACMPCTSLAPRGTKGSATGLCHCTGLNPIAPGGTIHEDFRSGATGTEFGAPIRETRCDRGIASPPARARASRDRSPRGGACGTRRRPSRAGCRTEERVNAVFEREGTAVGSGWYGRLPAGASGGHRTLRAIRVRKPRERHQQRHPELVRSRGGCDLAGDRDGCRLVLSDACREGGYPRGDPPFRRSGRVHGPRNQGGRRQGDRRRPRLRRTAPGIAPAFRPPGRGWATADGARHRGPAVWPVPWLGGSPRVPAHAGHARAVRVDR